MSEVQPILGSEYQGDENCFKVVVTGKIGSGKSTALNNIFDLQLETGSSPTRVTKSISRSKVTKNGNVFEVIDTPGLGGINQTTEDVVKEMKQLLLDSKFILLYCLPVKPSDTLTETDQKNIRSITSKFGKRVWEKCIILLTFSDIAEREFVSEKDTSNYLNYLKGHVLALHGLLKAFKRDVPEPKIIFEFESLSTSSYRVSLGQMVAIPVRKDFSHESDVLPGANNNVKIEVLNQIVQMVQLKRKTDEEAKKTYIKHVKFVLVGAGIGCLIGVLINPVIIIIGALIGAFIGWIISRLST